MLSFVQISCINVDATSCAIVSFNFCRATKFDEVERQKLDGWISMDAALHSLYTVATEIDQMGPLSQCKIERE